jgi:hypothetical protein
MQGILWQTISRFRTSDDVIMQVVVEEVVTMGALKFFFPF